MKRKNLLLSLIAAGLLVRPATADDQLTYALPDGTVRTAQVTRVAKDEEKDFSVRVRAGGTRTRKLEIPARLVIGFERGDRDATNQWSKRLSTGKRMLASGQLATQGTVPGAEEMFIKIAYTTEKGIKGEEAAYAARPWHNMYALYYLIQTRLKMGLAGDKAKLDAALANVDEFKKRTGGKKTLEWDVPAVKGTTKRVKVYGWGETRLTPYVLLLEAKILAAMGQKGQAIAAFDALIDRAKKGAISPHVLTDAMMAKADLEAAGEPSEKQENVYRAAGSILASLARTQPDKFGKTVLSRAANRALLKGADLLRVSAEQKKVGWDTPLNRYKALEASEGKRDPAVAVGARAGIGVCLTEQGHGEQAYQALLQVVVDGSDHPEQMALSLYYLGKAAKLFADEVESGGGKGDLLRAESARWWDDLKERFPTSPWAEKAK